MTIVYSGGVRPSHSTTAYERTYGVQTGGGQRVHRGSITLPLEQAQAFREEMRYMGYGKVLQSYTVDIGDQGQVSISPHTLHSIKEVQRKEATAGLPPPPSKDTYGYIGGMPVSEKLYKKHGWDIQQQRREAQIQAGVVVAPGTTMLPGYGVVRGGGESIAPSLREERILKEKARQKREYQIQTGQISTVTSAPERTKWQETKRGIFERAEKEKGVKGQVAGLGAFALGAGTGVYQTMVYPATHPIKTGKSLWAFGKETVKTKGMNVYLLGGKLGKTIQTQPEYATGYGLAAIFGGKAIGKGIGKLVPKKPVVVGIDHKTMVFRRGAGKGTFVSEATAKVMRKGWLRKTIKTGKIEVAGEFKPLPKKVSFIIKEYPLKPKTQLFYDIFKTPGKKTISKFVYGTKFKKVVTKGKGEQLAVKLPKRWYKGASVTREVGAKQSVTDFILGRTSKRVKYPQEIIMDQFGTKVIPPSTRYITGAVSKQVGKDIWGLSRGRVMEFIIPKQTGGGVGSWVTKTSKINTKTRTRLTPPPVSIQTLKTIAKKGAFPKAKTPSPSVISKVASGVTGFLLGSGIVTTAEAYTPPPPTTAPSKYPTKVSQIITPIIPATTTQQAPMDFIVPTTVTQPTITPPTTPSPIYPTPILEQPTPITKPKKKRLSVFQLQIQKQSQFTEQVMGWRGMQKQKQKQKQLSKGLSIHQPASIPMQKQKQIQLSKSQSILIHQPVSIQKQQQKLKSLLGFSYVTPTPTPTPTRTPTPTIIIPPVFHTPKYIKPKYRQVKTRRLRKPKRAYQPSVGSAILGYDISEKAFKKASKKRLIAGGIGLRPVVRRRKVKKVKRTTKKKKTKRRK